MSITFLICLSIFICATSAAYKIKYLNGLHESDECEISDGIIGTCQKISNCLEYFKNIGNNKSDLKICSFNKIYSDSVICCPKPKVEVYDYSLKFGNINEPQSLIKPNLLDFETCQKEFLKYREQKINPSYFGQAMYDGILLANCSNCKKLHALNKDFGPKDAYKHLVFYYCDKTNDVTYIVKKFIKYRKRFVRTSRAYYGNLSRRGDRANMVAIGWTKNDKVVEYKCGGSIITERFIVTAAHCKYYEKIQADTVRLGDRFLLNLHDDDRAQQHKILKFLQHPNFKSQLNYNDIAMIKTKTEIIFNNFVNPSCIGEFENEDAYGNEWTVAGYGETEDNIQSNVLMEIKVSLVSNQKCNSFFENSSKLPNGLIDSQFCVKSEEINGKVPDTCYGDSGSPLQTKLDVEIKDDNFNTTFLSTIYQTPVVLGLVSFGVNCGYNIPSVYTKLSYYKSWMRSVVENE